MAATGRYIFLLVLPALVTTAARAMPIATPAEMTTKVIVHYDPLSGDLTVQNNGHVYGDVAFDSFNLSVFTDGYHYLDELVWGRDTSSGNGSGFLLGGLSGVYPDGTTLPGAMDPGLTIAQLADDMWVSAVGSPGLAVRPDDFRLPFAPCSPGDTDGDGDIDTGDLTTAIQNFTGAGGTGKGCEDGDTDDDGDVDTGDLTFSIQNFTGASAGTGRFAVLSVGVDGELVGIPDLVGDPATYGPALSSGAGGGRLGTIVPEPGAMGLMGIGAIVLLRRR